MTSATFRVMRSSVHSPQIMAMMRALYREDPPATRVNTRAFARTIHFLLTHPARGRFILFIEKSQLVGYAILIPLWSNEFGGTLLLIDELFVRPENRSRGIAHEFFKWLKRKRPFAAVALALEVTPGNKRACGMYKSIGFIEKRNRLLIRR